MSLFVQTVVLLFTALLLDGGVLFRGCSIAAIAYWLGALFIVIRRRRNPTDNDVVLIKYGFPVAVGGVIIVQAVLTMPSRIVS